MKVGHLMDQGDQEGELVECFVDRDDRKRAIFGRPEVTRFGFSTPGNQKDDLMCPEPFKNDR